MTHTYKHKATGPGHLRPGPVGVTVRTCVKPYWLGRRRMPYPATAADAIAASTTSAIWLAVLPAIRPVPSPVLGRAATAALPRLPPTPLLTWRTLPPPPPPVALPLPPPPAPRGWRGSG